MLLVPPYSVNSKQSNDLHWSLGRLLQKAVRGG